MPHNQCKTSKPAWCLGLSSNRIAQNEHFVEFPPKLTVYVLNIPAYARYIRRSTAGRQGLACAGISWRPESFCPSRRPSLLNLHNLDTIPSLSQSSHWPPLCLHSLGCHVPPISPCAINADASYPLHNVSWIDMGLTVFSLARWPVMQRGLLRSGIPSLEA